MHKSSGDGEQEHHETNFKEHEQVEKGEDVHGHTESVAHTKSAPVEVDTAEKNAVERSEKEVRAEMAG